MKIRKQRTRQFEPDPAKFREHTGGQLGPFGGKLYESEKRLQREANELYDWIRLLNDDTVFISESSGFKEWAIEEIKQYIFYEKHEMFGDNLRFDASYYMGQAWKRLYDADPRESDILLLKHEWIEMQYVKRYNMDYLEAHFQANERYNWEAIIEENM